MNTKPRYCPRLEFTPRIFDDWPTVVRVEARTKTGRVAGVIKAQQLTERDYRTDYRNEDPAGDAFQVTWVKADARYRHCGIGTQLYTQLARTICGMEATLVSDTRRTPASEGFWAKQVRKGRADCGERGEVDRLRPDTRVDLVNDPWACRYYRLDCKHAHAGLDGVRKRR